MNFGSQVENDIIEGFLCPICKADLKSPDQLTNHFESTHKDQDVLKSLKDIFGKAKKKFLNLDENDLKETFDKALKFTPEDQSYYEIQQIGAIRSHFEQYKAIRSAKQEKYAAETNKLLIRLDKLVSNMPSDQTQRKAYEQDIVPWLDGSSVKWCPGCTKAFNITRRQHHCRLCGSILCSTCSYFFDLNIAKCIVDPSLKMNELQSHLDPMKNGLRLCEYCYKLIELRKQMQDSRNSKTILVTGYEQMRSIMDDTYPAIAMYKKMIVSLKNGETTYHLLDLSSLKSRIAKYAEGIDSLSKQIVNLEIAPSGSKTNRLQKSIRQAATYFIKEELGGLPLVPSEAEINDIRRSNSERAERRIQLERKQMENNLSRKYNIDAQSSTSRTVTEGWTTSTQSDSLFDNEEEHPIVEQMNRIRGYIKQARDDLKFEEVAILERNLKELKEEYYNQMSQSTH